MQPPNPRRLQGVPQEDQGGGSRRYKGRESDARGQDARFIGSSSTWQVPVPGSSVVHHPHTSSVITPSRHHTPSHHRALSCHHTATPSRHPAIPSCTSPRHCTLAPSRPYAVGAMARHVAEKAVQEASEGRPPMFWGRARANHKTTHLRYILRLSVISALKSFYFIPGTGPFCS